MVAAEPGYLVFYPTVAVAAVDGDGDTGCPCSRFAHLESHGRLDCFAHFDPVDHSVPPHHLGSTQNPHAHDAGYHCFRPTLLVAPEIVAAVVGKAFQHDVP